MNPNNRHSEGPNNNQSRCPFSWLQGLVVPPRSSEHKKPEGAAESTPSFHLNDPHIRASIEQGTLQLTNTSDWNTRYREYALLREQAPLYLHESTRTWVVTRYDDVKQLGRNPNLDLSKIIPDKIAPLMASQRESISVVTDSLRNWMIYQPSQEHLEIKKVFIRGFNKSSTELMAPAVRDAALRLLQNTPEAGSGRSFDFMGAYARPLPTLVLARMMGIPGEDLKEVERWTSDLTAFMADFVVANRLDPDIASRASSAIFEMQEYFERRVRSVREKSDGTILAHVAGSTDLPDKIITDQCIHIIFGGNKVPEYMAGNALYHILKSKEGYQAVSNSNVLLAQSVEEAARLESPVQFITRSVLQDFSYGRHTFRQGDSVYLVLGSANRDESLFPSPDVFDASRQGAAHLAFGVGTHTCVASGMVRSQLFEMLKVFTEHYPHVALTQSTAEPQWTDNATFHGLKELQIRV